ncbi:hypothetical protein FACS189437_06690 [Bacteroidia bacterium]|nr:hypothetical protein FACS189437_06690 [Bacteroidia bacterium]
MKSFKYTILHSFILIFAFCSCEKEIEFKGDVVEPKLVLNGFLTPDLLVTVHLSESRFFLSNRDGFRTIDDATVRLWKNDEVIETLSNAGEGYYTGNYRPETGDILRITASVPGLDAVDCSTEILPAPVILSVDTVNTFYSYEEYEGNYGYYMQENYDLNIRINDPKDLSNYYRINLYMRNYNEDGSYSDREVWFETEDKVFGSAESDFLEMSENPYRVFSDELFDGHEYKLKLRFENYYNYWGGGFDSGDTEERVPYRELHVDLQNLTKDYYLYLKTRGASWEDNLGGIVSEPVQIYTNINGGIGILGSYTSTIYKIPLRRK